MEAMTIERKSLSIGALLVVVWLFFGLSVVFGIDLYFAVAMSLWTAAFLYALSNIEKRMLFAVFLVAFFTFLLSGHFVYEYFGEPLNYYFNYDFYRHSNVLLSVSLVCLLLSQMVADYWQNHVRGRAKKRQDSWEEYANKEIIRIIRAVSRWGFYLTFPFLVMTVLDKALFVSGSGYAAYYVEYISSVSYPVRLLGSMAPYAFFVFLATMPKKLEALIPLVLYALQGAATLLTARRINFVTVVLFLIFYVMMRQVMGIYGENWISKKTVLMAVIVFPLMLIFLYQFNYTRLGQMEEEGSFLGQLIGFFRQQGISASVIRLEKFYGIYLNPDAPYSFYGIVKWIRTNSIVNLFATFDYGYSYAQNSVAIAVQGNSLAHAMSYMALALNRYQQGFGVGSCYIAELFYDFGIWGVMVGNMVYGAMMSWMNRWLEVKRAGILKLTLLFVVFESFVKAPRWNFDIIVTPFLTLAMWATLALIFGLSHLIYARRRSV